MVLHRTVPLRPGFAGETHWDAATGCWFFPGFPPPCNHSPQKPMLGTCVPMVPHIPVGTYSHPELCHPRGVLSPCVGPLRCCFALKLHFTE